MSPDLISSPCPPYSPLPLRPCVTDARLPGLRRIADWSSASCCMRAAAHLRPPWRPASSDSLVTSLASPPIALRWISTLSFRRRNLLSRPPLLLPRLRPGRRERRGLPELPNLRNNHPPSNHRLSHPHRTTMWRYKLSSQHLHHRLRVRHPLHVQMLWTELPPTADTHLGNLRHQAWTL